MTVLLFLLAKLPPWIDESGENWWLAIPESPDGQIWAIA